MTYEKKVEFVKRQFEDIRKKLHTVTYYDEGDRQMRYRLEEAEMWALKSLNKED